MKKKSDELENRIYTHCDFIGEFSIEELTSADKIPRLDQLAKFQYEIFKLPPDFKKRLDQKSTSSTYLQANLIIQYALKPYWTILTTIKTAFNTCDFEIKITGKLNNDVHKVSERIN